MREQPDVTITENMADEATKKKKSEETGQQSEDVEPQGGWFTQPRLPDDVTLKFDDGKNLFASRGLLMCASLVFEAMFTHEMKEKETNVVEMPGKTYGHFLEFLKCFHPGIVKPITHENVFFLVALAHEYQIKHLLQRCQDALRKIIVEKGTHGEVKFQSNIPVVEQIKKWLESQIEDGNFYWFSIDIIYFSNTILKILSSVAKFLDDLMTEAIDMLSYIKVKYYVTLHGTLTSAIHTCLKENIAMFDQMDVTLRARISMARLLRIDYS